MQRKKYYIIFGLFVFLVMVAFVPMWLAKSPLNEARKFVKSYGFLSEESGAADYYAEVLNLFKNLEPSLTFANVHNVVRPENSDFLQVENLMLNGAKSKRLGASRAECEANVITSRYVEIRPTEIAIIGNSVKWMALQLAREGKKDRAEKLAIALIAMALQLSEIQDKDTYGLAAYCSSEGIEALKSIRQNKNDTELDNIKNGFVQLRRSLGTRL